MAANSTEDILLRGPESFEDAEVVRNMFSRAATCAMLEQGETLARAMDDVNRWMKWLPVANALFRLRAEQLRKDGVRLYSLSGEVAETLPDTREDLPVSCSVDFEL